MLFLMYWELNEDVPVASRIQVAEQLSQKGLFPPKNIELLRFDITPDNWGVTLVEAESVNEITNILNMWRIACPGMFKTTKISPARPVQEAIAATAELIKEITT